MVAPPGSLVVVGGGRTPLLLGRATSGKSTFPTGPVNPVFSNSSTFHEVAGAVLLLAYCSVILSHTPCHAHTHTHTQTHAHTHYSYTHTHTLTHAPTHTHTNTLTPTTANGH